MKEEALMNVPVPSNHSIFTSDAVMVVGGGVAGVVRAGLGLSTQNKQGGYGFLIAGLAAAKLYANLSGIRIDSLVRIAIMNGCVC
jgi:hypothetical protein